MKRLLFGPRRRTPLELGGAALAPPGGAAGAIRGVEPALPWGSVDDGPPRVIGSFADEESRGALAGKDGGGIGVELELAVLPETGPLLFLVSFRFPFPGVCFSTC